MFQHLLVPLDGSELAETALPMAKAIAVRFNSQITLVRAVHLPQYMGDGLDFSEVYTNLDKNMQAEAKVYLAGKQKALETAGFEVNSHIVIGEPAADAILLAASELGVDMIVMSTHGRGGVMRWVFGSVADKVLRQAEIPILLTRSPAVAGTMSPMLATEGKDEVAK